MTTQTEHALALLFQRFRDAAVDENELVKVMSLTLNWTKPSRATNLLDRGVNAGLLDRDGDTYRATFDPTEVDVPFGFSPDDEIFDPVPTPDNPDTGDADEADVGTETPSEPSPSAPTTPETATEAAADSDPDDALDTTDDAISATDRALLEGLLERIAERLEDGDHKRAVAAVNAKQDALGGAVTLEVAALLVGKETGLDVTDDARAVLDDLRETATA